jgi:DNA-3-methyladenine glycosylase II
VSRQVARILSLDADGEAWMAVGERDPVIGELQTAHPGQRPVLFHSPYEAAGWAAISARMPYARAAGIRDALVARARGDVHARRRAVAGIPTPAAPARARRVRG